MPNGIEPVIIPRYEHMLETTCNHCGVALGMEIEDDAILTDEGPTFCGPQCMIDWIAENGGVALHIMGANIMTMNWVYPQAQPKKPVKDEISKLEDGSWKYNCIECGSSVPVHKEEDTKGVRLCSKCEQKYDIEHLWTDHDNGWVNAHDFNKRNDIRQKYKKGKWGLKLKFNYKTIRDAEEALQMIRAEYNGDIINSGIINNETGEQY